MANPTTNYGFVLPTSSDLVTDLPADFDVALQGVDTRLKALQPGTTLGDLAYSSATANTNTRLAVGTTGQVLTVAGGVPSWATPASTTPTYVGVSTYKNAAQTISNGTFTAITFQVEDFDTDAFHDNSTNNTRFTIPSGKAGKYMFTGTVAFLAGVNATGPRNVAIYKNGTAYNYQASQFAVSPSPYGTNLKVGFVMNLAVADYVELFAFQLDGASLDVAQGQSNTNVQMTYLGA